MKFLEAALEVLPTLLESGQTDAALKTFQHVFEGCKTYQQVGLLVTRLLPLLNEMVSHPKALALSAAALCGAREAERLLERTSPYLGTLALLPETQVYVMWAWVNTGQFQQALEVPDALLEQLPIPEQGLFQRFKAQAMAGLNISEWRERMATAKKLLTGERLGRALIAEADCLMGKNQAGAARACWAEALRHLRDDPYYQAWTHYNLGISLKEQQSNRAEKHLLEARKLSDMKAANSFRARGWCGLADVRRTLGDWRRALYAYTKAVKAEGDSGDHQEALWGVGNMWRLMGQPEMALQNFRDALDQKVPESAWLHADIAAARLKLDDFTGAQSELEQVDNLGPRSGMLGQLVRLELMRLWGDLKGIGQYLAQIQLEPSSWLHDEVHCFPELFAALKGFGLVIEATPLVEQTVVQVWAERELRVVVNGRPLELSPKTSELLVRLLETKGSERSSLLMLDLYPHHTLQTQRKTQSALWQLSRGLCDGLGWEAVEVWGSIYRLDQTATWEYDMAHLPKERWVSFLLSSTSDWVEAKRQQAVPDPEDNFE